MEFEIEDRPVGEWQGRETQPLRRDSIPFPNAARDRFPPALRDRALAIPEQEYG